MWVAAFAVQKLLTFFSAKNIRILCIESAKTVNEMTLNELVKLTKLWTTGSRMLRIKTIFSTQMPWITYSVGSSAGDLLVSSLLLFLKGFERLPLILDCSESAGIKVYCSWRAVSHQIGNLTRFQAFVSLQEIYYFCLDHVDCFSVIKSK